MYSEFYDIEVPETGLTRLALVSLVGVVLVMCVIA
jgi:hypothetical protein